MGTPKLLLPFGGSTVIGCTAEALRRGGADRVLLVSAPQDDDLHQWAREQGWEIAINPDVSRGMLSSIQRGLEALGGYTALQTLLVCPADHPLLRAETVARVLEASIRSGALLTAPLYRNRRGHPLAIARSRIREIPELDASIGLRQLLLDHPEDLLQIEVDDPGSVRDLDTSSDYDHLRELSRNREVLPPE